MSESISESLEERVEQVLADNQELRDRVQELENKVHETKQQTEQNAGTKLISDQPDDGWFDDPPIGRRGALTGAAGLGRRAFLAGLASAGVISLASSPGVAQTAERGSACLWLGDQQARGYGLYGLGAIEGPLTSDAEIQNLVGSGLDVVDGELQATGGGGGSSLWEFVSGTGLRPETAGRNVVPNGTAQLGTTSDPWNNVVSNQLDLVQVGNPAYTEGRVWYSSTTSTLSYYSDIADEALNPDEEVNIRVFNATGSTISKGEVVRFNGNQANLPTITPAQADSYANVRGLAVVMHDIGNNSEGIAVQVGVLRDIDTSAFGAGDPLWLSDSTPGAVTATRPGATSLPVRIGSVLEAKTQGQIQIHITHEWSHWEAELREDVSVPAEGTWTLVSETRPVLVSMRANVQIESSPFFGPTMQLRADDKGDGFQRIIEIVASLDPDLGAGIQHTDSNQIYLRPGDRWTWEEIENDGSGVDEVNYIVGV